MSDSSNINPKTGKQYESGTAEEFQIAVQRKREGKEIKIAFCFKEPDKVPKTKQESEQLTKVLEFKDDLKSTSWINDFGKDDFYGIVYQLILDYVWEFEEKLKIRLRQDFLDIEKKTKINKGTVKIERVRFYNNIPVVDFYIPRFVKPLNEINKQGEIFFAEEQHSSSLKDVVLKDKRVVLLGSAGSGKSVELFHLIEQLEIKVDAPFIPIFKKLNTYVDEDIENFLPKEWIEVPEEILLLVLDGLDEIQPQHFNTAARKIISFAERHRQAHILISSRTNFYELPSATTNGTLSPFNVFFIEEVGVKDVKEFVTNEHKLNGEALIHQAYQEGYFDLITRPFFLNILIKQFKQEGHLKSNRSKIINDFILSRIELDVNHYKLTVQIREKKNEILALLQKVALVMESLGRNFVLEEELLKILGNSSDFELIKYFTAFGKKVGQDDIWMFEHNNIQEYLAAIALSNHTFETIKKFVSFPPSNSKIKPSWVNTLSFLISISDKQKDDIINWLSEDDFEVIIKFEPDRVSEEMRFQLLKKIFYYYKEKDIWLRSNKFNNKELARFSQSERSIDFLIGELDASNSTRTKQNAIHLLDDYNFETLPIQTERLKSTLLEIIDNSEDEDYYFMYAVLYAIAKLKFNDSQTIDRIVRKFKERKNQYIRAGLYSIINKSPFVNEYVDLFLAGIIIENSQTSEDRDHVSLSDEGWEIKEGLKQVTSPEGLKKVFKFLESRDNIQSFRYHNDSEIFKAIIDNAASVYEKDTTLYDAVLGLFKAFIKIYDTYYSTLLASFFERTKTDVKAFENIWTDTEIPVQQKETLLSSISNKSIITVLIQGYKNHDYTNSDINYFYKIILWNFGRNPNNLIPFFEEQVNEQTNIILPKQPIIDYAKIHKQRKQQSFDLLFDKEAFQKEVNGIFDQFEKEELYGNNLWDYRKNDKGLSEESFPIIAFEFVRGFTLGGKIVDRGSINKWFDNHKKVEYYQIENIYDDLKDKTELEINSSKIEFIKDWCITVATYDKIASAVKATEDYRSFSVNRRISILWFFIKRFKLQFSDNIMLAFTLFEDFEAINTRIDEKSEIDELEEFVEKKKVEDKVVNNLELDINTDRIWKNNALYAIRNSLTAAYPFIIRDLKNYKKSEYYRPDVLKFFYSKTKDFKTLESILNEIGRDPLSWSVVENLVDDEQQSKDFLLKYLQNRMDEKSETLENRLFAARHLIELDDIKGLKFYADYFIKKNDPNIEYNYISRSFTQLKDSAAIPILLELLALSKLPDFQVDGFNRLDALVLDSLYNIGIAGKDNLEKVKMALLNFIEKHKNAFPDLNFLHLTIDRLEYQFYMQKSKSLTLEEAIQEYYQLV